MSKIICDVCGTSFQDSAMQCPICGCVRPADVPVETNTTETEIIKREGYTYVKGGRFSKANVQKRNQGISLDKGVPKEADSVDRTNKGDKGLVIAVCALLIAIIAVVIYIVLHFFAPGVDTIEPTSTTQAVSTSQTTEATTLAPVVENVPCTEINIPNTEIVLTEAGETYLLDVTLNPEDTTDKLLFTSEDESVASVSDSGEILAVSNGETVITLNCGEVSVHCNVVCQINEAPVVDQTEATNPAVEYKAPFKINKSDVSITLGETFVLKLVDATGEIIPVVWSATIADICTIDGNSITGAERGKTELSVTYGGETYTCIVRVR